MSNLFTGSPYAIPKQAIVGVVPIVGIETQIGNRAISYVLLTDGTVDGAWLIEASNDFARDMHVSMGNNANLGTWVDVTALFKRPDGTAIAVVAHASAPTQKQYAQCPVLASRVVRATFIPSAGAGNVSAAGAGGSYT